MGLRYINSNPDAAHHLTLRQALLALPQFTSTDIAFSPRYFLRVDLRPNRHGHNGKHAVQPWNYLS